MARIGGESLNVFFPSLAHGALSLCAWWDGLSHAYRETVAEAGREGYWTVTTFVCDALDSTTVRITGEELHHYIKLLSEGGGSGFAGGETVRAVGVV